MLHDHKLLIFVTLGLALLIGVLFYFFRRLRVSGELFGGLSTDTVTVDDWTFRYHISGRGPHLLLIHGIGADLFCWRWIVPLLKKRFTIIALDLPGFGQSTKNKKADYGLDDQVERVLNFLDQIKVRSTFVVGNSMGGNIALWLARTAPDRIDGVCVIAPATSPKLVPMGLTHLRWLSTPLSYMVTRSAMRWAHRRTVSRKDKVDVGRVEETFKTYGRNPEAVRSFMLATQAIRDHRLPEALSDIRTKVLILWGANDLLVSQKVITRLEDVLNNSKSFVHAVGGHHLQEDEPDWVSDKISTFFLHSLD